MTLNEQFKKNGFVVLENVLLGETLEILSIDFKMMRDTTKYLSGLSDDEFKIEYSDTQVPKSFNHYSAYCFESLLVYLKPKMEEIIGKELYATYCYARIMQAGASMAKHRDRPSCQYSATLCIQDDKTHPYPIYIENYEGEVSCVTLEPGSMLVYHGTQLNHWRQEFFGSEHIQTFLHYVDANGPYKNYKYDKRPILGLSSDYKGVNT